MKTFDQDTPYSSSKPSHKPDSFFDDYEVVDSYGGTSSFESLRSAAAWDFDRPSPSRTKDEDTVITTKPKSSYRASEVDTSASSDDARKKFGNAKAISSDQYFGPNKDNDYEVRTNLARFEGKSSISSADYFGDGQARNQAQSSRFQNTLQSVDLDDVKESVRQGVTKVAGRLSSMANGVMSSIHDKYGY